MATATDTTNEQKTRDDQLQALIRLIAPARALKEDLEKSVHLELYNGTGDFALKSVRGLQASVAQITNDPFLTNLTLEVPEAATDKEKVSLASLAASQLAAYLIGQTGVTAATSDFGGGGTGNGNISTGTHISINFNDIQGATPETIGKMVDMSAEALKQAEKKPTEA